MKVHTPYKFKFKSPFTVSSVPDTVNHQSKLKFTTSNSKQLVAHFWTEIVGQVTKIRQEMLKMSFTNCYLKIPSLNYHIKMNVTIKKMIYIFLPYNNDDIFVGF